MLHSSLAITAFITSKQSNFVISTKVKMKMQLRLTKFTFQLVGSNFIISTKEKMKMQLRIANFTFHLVGSNFIISTKVKMKMQLRIANFIILTKVKIMPKQPHVNTAITYLIVNQTSHFILSKT